ncbi:MAG TPA: polysaccharide biosynthesis tyrosine autokinase [Opitutaceae bacterium]|nr:polysaccharide biosynthesis tyrosine autokinase [Opitutaceae bacterium]
MPTPVTSEPAPPPSAAASAANTRDEHAVERRTLRDYYIIVRERLWIALPVAFLVALPLGYYQMQETPMYESHATMQFERPEKIVMVDQVVDQTPKSDIDINTYLQRLNSASLRAKVIESLTPDDIKVLQRPYLKDLAPGASPPSPAAALGSVFAEPVRGSLILLITARHRDPEAAALVANRFYQEFVNYLMSKSGGSNEEAVAFLQKRATELEKEYEQKEQRLQEYKKEHNLISLDDSLNIVTDRLKSVNAARTAAHLERLNLEVYYNQVETFRKERRDLLEISYIANHGTIPALKGQLAETVQRQAVLGERYLERHPQMIEVAKTISLLRDQLDKAIDLAIADLNASLEKARDSEQSLDREYSRQEKEQLRLDDLKVEYRSLEDQAAVAKNAYSQVLDSLNKTTTSKGLDYRIPVSLLDRAVPNFAPYTPNKTRIARTCVMVGLLVFLGVAFGLSVIDDRIKSAWDVESYIGVNLLGIIPDLSNVKDEDKHMLAIRAKATPGVEAFLSVYSAVKIQSKLDYPKIILVTSTIPGEGKTLISCNLAGAFARHGRSTLLMDCDMRRPMLHRHFNLPNEAGILAWAEAGASLEGDLLANPQLGITHLSDSLSLLRSGGRSKSPTEFLEKPVFGQFLEQLKRRYDLIVIDSPPVGAVSDSLLIGEYADELIYVCRFNRAYRKHIRQFVRTLREGQKDFLGIVLNGLSPRRIEYYTNYRYYRSYKKYYGSQT